MNTPLRVLHVIPSVSIEHGGPSFVLRNLTVALAQQGVSVEVLTTNDNGLQLLQVPTGCPVVEDGVTYNYFHRQTNFYKVSLPMASWAWRHVRDYDLIHIHALFSWSSTVAAAAAIAHHVPYIVRPLGVLNRWGLNKRRPLWKRLSFAAIERRILENSVAVHYTADEERIEAEMLDFRSASVIIGNPVSVGESTVPDALRHRYPELRGKTILLFLSRIAPKKGLDLLLKAFAALAYRHPQLALVIAGSGDEVLTRQLQQKSKDLAILNPIIWTGFVNGQDKWDILAGSNIFVLPSYSENFGVAAVEAMAMGLPVVLTDQVGIHEIVSRSGAGLIASCNAEDIDHKIETLLSSASLQRSMGDAGRHLAFSEYSREAIARKLVTLYRRILTNTPLVQCRPQ